MPSRPRRRRTTVARAAPPHPHCPDRRPRARHDSLADAAWPAMVLGADWTGAVLRHVGCHHPGGGGKPRALAVPDRIRRHRDPARHRLFRTVRIPGLDRNGLHCRRPHRAVGARHLATDGAPLATTRRKRVMKRWWMAALVLVLPLAGLATTTLHNELALANAEEWAIPVTGFDPRDPLRGHYIVFRYLWDVEGDSDLCRAGQCLICLTPGEDGSVTARIVPRAEDPDCPSRVDPQASQISPDFISRIYVAETRALDLER